MFATSSKGFWTVGQECFNARMLTAVWIYISLFWVHVAEASQSQACTQPEKSPMDWKPRPAEVRIFQFKGRELRVTIPPLYNETEVALPLILAYPDKDMSTKEMMDTSLLSDPNYNPGIVVVYIEPFEGTWQSDITPLRAHYKPTQPQSELREETDLEFTAIILSDLGEMICYDQSRVYATGLGIGGGMSHLLACDPVLSTRIAAFAPVAAGFGHPKRSKDWEKCNPGRLPIPMMEIHGEDDMILPYILTEWEQAKKRLPLTTWLDDWSERNGCGETVGDTMPATDGTGLEVMFTRLSGGGWQSEGNGYRDTLRRLAKSCPQAADKGSKTAASDGEDADDEETVVQAKPEDMTILHYKLKGVGHGWPRQQLKVDKSKTDESLEEIAKKSLFDTTRLVLDWFLIHKLQSSEREPSKTGPATTSKDELTDENLNKVDKDERESQQRDEL